MKLVILEKISLGTDLDISFYKISATFLPIFPSPIIPQTFPSSSAKKGSKQVNIGQFAYRLQQRRPRLLQSTWNPRDKRGRIFHADCRAAYLCDGALSLGKTAGL